MQHFLLYLFEYIWIPLSIPVCKILIDFLINKRNNKLIWFFDSGFEIAIISFFTSIAILMNSEKSNRHIFFFLPPILLVFFQAVIILLISDFKKKYNENIKVQYFNAKSFILGLFSLSLHINLAIYCYSIFHANVNTHYEYLKLGSQLLCLFVALLFVLYLIYSKNLYLKYVYPVIDRTLNSGKLEAHKKVQSRAKALRFIFDKKERIFIKKTIIHESKGLADLENLRIKYLINIINYQINTLNPGEREIYSELLAKEFHHKGNNTSTRGKLKKLKDLPLKNKILSTLKT